jgi:NitT/TauT family transport system substrate-binding protein
MGLYPYISLRKKAQVVQETAVLPENRKKSPLRKSDHLRISCPRAHKLHLRLQALRRRGGMSLALNCLIMDGHFFEKVRDIVDRVRQFLAADCISPSRRDFLTTSAAVASGLAMTSFIGLDPAAAAPLKEVRFSEAVHNLGYINLYVGMHAGIFEKNGLNMKVSAAGGDTQTFAAVLGGSADFAIGDATMAQISRENGGPGVVVGTVVQRAHYFGVSKTLKPITDPKDFKGLKIVTSPEPNTNYSVAKRLLEKAGLKVGVDATIVPVNPGTEIAAMLAGQADIAIAYQPSVAAAEAQGAKVVFDFSSYIGPFCNTGIMVLPTTIQQHPQMVQALVTSFEEASRKTYADPAFAKKVAREEFPDLPGDVVDKAIDAELTYLIPAQSVVTKKDQWKNLMDMQVYLGNAKGTIPFDQIIDNSFAEKAVASANERAK